MGKLIEDFEAYRTKMNDRIMETANTNIKRFFALDTTTYADGALDVKTKEMLGLVASMRSCCLFPNIVKPLLNQPVKAISPYRTR